MFLMLTDFTTV